MWIKKITFHAQRKPRTVCLIHSNLWLNERLLAIKPNTYICTIAICYSYVLQLYAIWLCFTYLLFYTLLRWIKVLLFWLLQSSMDNLLLRHLQARKQRKEAECILTEPGSAEEVVVSEDEDSSIDQLLGNRFAALTIAKTAQDRLPSCLCGGSDNFYWLPSDLNC